MVQVCLPAHHPRAQVHCRGIAFADTRPRLVLWDAGEESMSRRRAPNQRHEFAGCMRSVCIGFDRMVAQPCVGSGDVSRS